MGHVQAEERVPKKAKIAQLVKSDSPPKSHPNIVAVNTSSQITATSAEKLGNTPSEYWVVSAGNLANQLLSMLIVFLHPPSTSHVRWLPF